MSSRAVASSSMTRTLSAVGERRPSEPVELLACESALPGRRTVKTEPSPGSLATVTSPPIMRASLRVIARPSPVPPYWRVGLLLRCHTDAGIGHGDLDPVAAVDHLFDAQLNL